MNHIISTAKVMQNFTICISKPIREKLQIKRGDEIILTLTPQGELKLVKAITTLNGLVGMGKKTFKDLGGGEAFIKKERAQWEK